MDKIQRALDLAALHRPGAAPDEVSGAERAAVRREFTPPPMEPARRLSVDWAQLRENRIVDGADRRPAAQAYRMLRTQVLQRARAHRLSTIGVISAASGEGKTLTAINLALAPGTRDAGWLRALSGVVPVARTYGTPIPTTGLDPAVPLPAYLSPAGPSGGSACACDASARHSALTRRNRSGP